MSEPRKWKTWHVAAIGLLALVLGGVAAGGSAEEPPKESAKLAAAEKRADEAEKKAADAVTAAKATLEAQYAEREKAVADKELALVAREKAVTEAEQAKKASTFGDGVYEVNVDIQPGTYKTDGGARCYWEKTAKDGDILANDNVTGPTVVVIESSVFSFKSSNCGTWRKTG